jgi:hypothetical protein
MSINLIQSATNGTSSNGPTLVLGFASPVATGHFVVIAVNMNSTPTLGAISDTSGNTYTKTINGVGSNQNFYMCYAANVTGGFQNITLNFLSTGYNVEAIAREYSGITDVSPFVDQSRAAGNTSTTSWTSGNMSATTHAVDLLVAAAGNANSAATSFGLGSGFNNLIQQAQETSYNIAMEDQTVSSTGTYAGTFTANATSSGEVGIIAFIGGNTISVSDSPTLSDQLPSYYSDQIDAMESYKLLSIAMPNVSDSSTTSENSVVQPPLVQVNTSDSTTTSEFVDIPEVLQISVLDTCSGLEVINANLADNANVSDTTTTSESVNIAKALQISVSDSTTTSENMVISADENVRQTESATTSENTILLNTEFITTSDSSATSESLTIIKFIISVSDTAMTSESQTVLLTDYFIAQSDTVTTSESMGIVSLSLLNFSDSVTTSEYLVVDKYAPADKQVVIQEPSTTSDLLPSYYSDLVDVMEYIAFFFPPPDLTVSVSDTSTHTESVTIVRAQDINVSDTSTTSESVTAFLPFYNVIIADNRLTDENGNFLTDENGNILTDGTGSDIIDTAEFTNIAGVWFVNVSDSVTTSEFSKVVAFSINVSDSTTTLENLVVNATGNVNFLDITVTSEFISLSPESNPSVLDSTILSESIRFSTDTALSVQDILNTNELMAPVLSGPNFFIVESELVSTAESVTFLNQLGNVSVSDSTTLSESRQAEVNSFISRSDTATTSELVNPNRESSLQVSDTAHLSENILPSISVFFISVSDSTTLSELILFPTPILVNESETTTVTDSVTIKLINYGATSITSITIVVPPAYSIQLATSVLSFSLIVPNPIAFSLIIPAPVEFILAH